MSQSDVDVLLADAQTALRNKEFATALDLVNAVHEIEPDNEDAARLMRFIDVASKRNRGAEARSTAPLKLGSVRNAGGEKSNRRTSPIGVTPVPETEASGDENSDAIRKSYEAGDYESVIAQADAALAADPDHDVASRYKRFAELALRKRAGTESQRGRQTRKLAASRVLKRGRRKKS